jgi:hypothetical protein
MYKKKLSSRNDVWRFWPCHIGVVLLQIGVIWLDLFLVKRERNELTCWSWIFKRRSRFAKDRNAGHFWVGLAWVKQLFTNGLCLYYVLNSIATNAGPNTILFWLFSISIKDHRRLKRGLQKTTSFEDKNVFFFLLWSNSEGSQHRSARKNEIWTERFLIFSDFVVTQFILCLIKKSLDSLSLNVIKFTAILFTRTVWNSLSASFSG